MTASVNELGLVVLYIYWSNTGQILFRASDQTGDPLLIQQDRIRKLLKHRHIFRNIMITFKDFPKLLEFPQEITSVLIFS
jgi:hypothetical protein